MKNNTSGNLIEPSSPLTTEPGNFSGKPQGLPEKFWDEKTGEVKLEALIEDYNYMASRDENLIEGNNRRLPESFDKYELNIPHPFLDRDEDIFKRFYENGFTNEQAQLVYDLANERVIPVLSELTSDFEAEKQLEKLKRYFGSEEKFNEVSRQISTWARGNLQPEVYDALASTSEGVIALYKMMSSNEPVLGRERDASEELSEDSLRKMMEDPRYWRDKDKSYVAKITKGFEKLYPEK